MRLENGEKVGGELDIMGRNGGRRGEVEAKLRWTRRARGNVGRGRMRGKVVPGLVEGMKESHSWASGYRYVSDTT